MWLWQQAQHTMMDPAGRVLDRTGYSGKGTAKNDPDKQCVVDQGPIPRGTYTVGPAMNHPRLGPVSIPLTPHPINDMCQRFGFFIHGESVSDPGNASDGCIVLPRASREAIHSSTDKTLEVVRGVQVGASLDLASVSAIAESTPREARTSARSGSELKRRAAKGARTSRSQGKKSKKKGSTRLDKAKKNKGKRMGRKSKRRPRSNEK